MREVYTSFAVYAGTFIYRSYVSMQTQETGNLISFPNATNDPASICNQIFANLYLRPYGQEQIYAANLVLDILIFFF